MSTGFIHDKKGITFSRSEMELGCDRNRGCQSEPHKSAVLAGKIIIGKVKAQEKN